MQVAAVRSKVQQGRPTFRNFKVKERRTPSHKLPSILTFVLFILSLHVVLLSAINLALQKLILTENFTVFRDLLNLHTGEICPVTASDFRYLYHTAVTPNKLPVHHQLVQPLRHLYGLPQNSVLYYLPLSGWWTWQGLHEVIWLFPVAMSSHRHDSSWWRLEGGRWAPSSCTLKKTHAIFQSQYKTCIFIQWPQRTRADHA